MAVRDSPDALGFGWARRWSRSNGMDNMSDAELADALQRLANQLTAITAITVRAKNALRPKPEPPSEPIAGDDEDGVRL
jgi:hypothetical protein